MKQIIRKAANVLGYTIIPTWRLALRPMAEKVAELISLYEIDTIVDVGANEGQFRDFARYHVGFSGQIESFEPIPELYQRLSTKAKQDDRWNVHPFALGSSKGTMVLNVMNGSEFSSFLNPKVVGTDQQIFLNTVSQKITVEVSTLDSVFCRSLRGHRIYLKLDTQGFDLEVLRGLVEGSGDDDTSITARAGATYSYRFSETLSGTLSYTYLNRSVDDGSGYHENLVAVGLSKSF